MVRRVAWVSQDEMWPFYRLNDFVPDLPPGLVERYNKVMTEFFQVQRELSNLYHNGVTSIEPVEHRKVFHPAVPDDSIPLPYEEYDL